MKKLKVGYLSLVKGSWINESLESKRKHALESLSKLDCELVDCGLLIQSETEAVTVTEKFEAAGVDVILAHFITFSLGTVVPGMAVKLGVPVIFWSEPEPPMLGKRIEANSFCASNMNAHALWKMNVKYSLVYGDHNKALKELEARIKVFACLKYLKNVRIGSAGGRVPGFYTSNFSELAMRAKFGAEVEGITLLELVSNAGKIKPEALKTALAEVKGKACCSDLSKEELEKGAALYASFKELTAKYRLDAWTVRCWPEFADIYGIGVCHILGTLTGSGVPAACEGDVYGALAMLITKEISGRAPFFCDLISCEPEGDTGIFWHCGAAPVELCKENCCPELKKHSIINGGGKMGIASEFPLQKGSVTVLRIGESRDGASYRMLIIKGEAQDTEQLLHGNPLKVRFNRSASELVEKLIGSGFEHHYVMARGDISAQLKFMAAQLDLEVIEL